MTPRQRQLFLEKFAARQHTEAEHRAFLRWLREEASGPELEEALAHYEYLQRLTLPPAPDPRLMAKIEARLDSISISRSDLEEALPTQTWWRSVVAAVLAVLAVAGGAYWLQKSMPKQAAPEMVYLRKSVPAGHTDSLTLTDGSTIVLNAGSTLRYPRLFAPTRRDVYLEGEAYFRVAKNPTRPFVIHSGALQTQVVGTSFNVYAYPGAARQEVTVLTGKVIVSDSAARQRVTLVPAQQAVFEKASRQLRAQPVAHPALRLAWRQGLLQFEDATLDEVLDKVSTRYGVAIRARTPHLHRCRLTVRFRSESVAEVLQVLAALTHSRTHTDSHHVTWLEGRGCS